MRAEKDDGKTKVERLIETMDRLTAALLSLHQQIAPKPQPQREVTPGGQVCQV